MMPSPEPVTLRGGHVQLEPLDWAHRDALLQAAQDPEIWRWALSDPRTPETMDAYIAQALREQVQGIGLPFAVRHLASDRLVGSTRYMNIARADHGLEIGWTWYAAEARRTAVNTECKLLLLAHAFDRLGCIRVELKTDARNQHSRTAILRLGAVEEGTLRAKVLLHDGYRRDTVYFSILDHEWRAVRQRLEGLLRRAGEQG